MRPLIQPLFLLIATASLGLGQGQPAKAHAIESTLNYLDGSLELQSHFSTGTPVEGAVVRVLEPNGAPGRELGRMDQQGKLSLSLPDMQEGTLDLQVDAGPGHRDYLMLPIRSGKVRLDEVVTHPKAPQTPSFLISTESPLLLGLAGLLFSVRSQRIKS